jgi:hypothetical protein
MGVDSTSDDLKKKFISIHDEINAEKFRREEILKKMREWNHLVESKKGLNFTLEIKEKDLKRKSLKLYRNESREGEWHFPFPVLLKGIFEEIYIDGARFNAGLKIEGEFDEEYDKISSYFEVKNFYFNDVWVVKEFLVRGAKFLEDVRFSGCRFDNCINKIRVNQVGMEYSDYGAWFKCNYFLKKSSFDVRLNKGNFSISDCEFYDDAEFSIHDSASVILAFNKFEKSFQFAVHSGCIRLLRLSSSEFFGKALIYKIVKSIAEVKEIEFDWAIFRDVLVIKIGGFTSAPNFPEANFIDSKKLSLNAESWEKNGKIDSNNIVMEDELKFRFLKKYFAEQGNHFKEQQYFSYEMMAREKKLKIEKGREWWLFKIYKNLSNFGMSVGLPFGWLCVSLSVFFIVNLLFGCDINSSFTNSVVRTLNPLAKFECEATNFFNYFLSNYFSDITQLATRPMKISNPMKIVSAFQSIINAALIFLFILGLRNKFKIK